MNIGDALKTAAEIVLDEKVAEIQLHTAAVDEQVSVDLPRAGQIEWNDGGRRYAVTAFTVKRVK